MEVQLKENQITVVSKFWWLILKAYHYQSIIMKEVQIFNQKQIFKSIHFEKILIEDSFPVWFVLLILLIA
jgi:hypothetical protein